MRFYKIVVSLFMLLFFLLTPLSPTLAKDAKMQTKSGQKKAADTKQPPVEKKDVKIFIDKITVEGRLEKPQVMLFLPGQTPEIDDIQIDRSFMKNIFRPVENRVTVETKYRADYTKNQKSVIEW